MSPEREKELTLQPPSSPWDKSTGSPPSGRTKPVLGAAPRLSTLAGALLDLSAELTVRAEEHLGEREMVRG